MDLREAYNLLTRDAPDPGRFLGPPADGLSIGAGLILGDVTFPAYDVGEGAFVVGDGMVYVISHECDLDADNDRPFNDSSVVCPIIPLDVVVEKYLATLNEEQLSAFLDAIGKRTVERVLFVPAIADVLPYGGLLYFGTLTHTHISELTKEAVRRHSAVTAYGLNIIDLALERAIRRPKAQRLAFAPREGGHAPA